MGLLVPFGLHKSGRVIEIKEAVKGLACDCVCTECGTRLVANKKDDKKAAHFSHHDNKNCIGAFESAIHKAAKQIILDNNIITLPRKDGHFAYTAKEVERFFTGFRADALISNESSELIIEIRVKHEVDAEKLERIKAQDIKAIEIDLSKITEIISLQELANLVLHTPANRKYLVPEEKPQFPPSPPKSDDTLFYVIITLILSWLLFWKGGRNR